MDHLFKTQPFEHQLAEFERTKDAVAHGRLWEMGTGKTKVTIDESVHLFRAGKINGHMILAPNGVHRNWVVEEFPRHLPDQIPSASFWYDGSRSSRKEYKAAVEKFLKTPLTTLANLAMSYDSMMTEHGRAIAKRFLTSRRCLYTLDEARRIANPDAKRTKRVLSSSSYGHFRRILNGTPISNGPFDIYSQVKFLDPLFWPGQGISSFTGFKTMFANFKQITVAGGRLIPVVDSYKNLELLQKMLDKICTRVTKDDVLDLPPKLFSRRSFDMTAEQWRLYRQLQDDFIAFLNSGEEVTATLALTRLLRLQQITSGYLPADGTQRLVDISESNPRLALLGEICEDIPHKAIIWTRFRRDIEKICDMLGYKAVRYDGSVDAHTRGEAIERFQRGDAQFFVANPQAAGEGLTLHAARTVIYYAHSFNLAERLQSEDRAHRIGQEHPVEYIDFVASGTVDEEIVSCLVKKLDVASQITGDNLRSWLSPTC